MINRLKIILRSFFSILKPVFKYCTISFGIIALSMIGLAFTDIPYNAYHSLGRTDLMQKNNINHIVILGGDGMPSPSTLIRVYFAKQLAEFNPNANIYIALPKNEDGSTIQLSMIKDELIESGIASDRIIFESEGFNTYSQAKNLSALIDNKKDTTLLITSPEHMHRAILTFGKQGFKSLAAFPTFEIPSDESQLIEKDKKGKKKSSNLSLRYNVWSYLIYEIKVLREYTALAYYKLNGWI